MLDTGDEDLGFKTDDGKIKNNNQALQMSLSIKSGSAELFIDKTGQNFPNKDDTKTYTQPSINLNDPDIDSFRVINIDFDIIVTHNI